VSRLNPRPAEEQDGPGLDRATMTELEAIVSAVSLSKKYRTLCRDTIRRIAEHEMAKHGNTRAAIKGTKRQLHQIHGAFERAPDYDVLYPRLEAAYRAGADGEIKAACRGVMDLHSSTRERLSILDPFFPSIFQVTGRPRTILDLGCGLNPLALPWMDLPAGARYLALDIDRARVAFLNRYLVLAGLEPLARCQDVLSHAPEDPADVAFLLKMSPSLECQEPGATLRLLQQLTPPWVVVSFAVKSLGGREKGMAQHYEQQFLASVRGRQWQVKRLAFAAELVFAVRREA
jgi:16S rRNA (guanine(1405)-N(7))-methyltransferase